MGAPNQLAELFVKLSVQGQADLSRHLGQTQREIKTLAQAYGEYETRLRGADVMIRGMSKAAGQSGTSGGVDPMIAMLNAHQKPPQAIPVLDTIKQGYRGIKAEAVDMTGQMEPRLRRLANLKWFKTDEGKEFLRLQKDVQKETERLERQMRPFSDKLHDVASTATRIGAYGSAGILGSVASASPEIFGTFTGSIRLLSAEIGRSFAPAIITVSGWIQKAAFFIRSIDDGTKRWIGTLVVAGTVLATFIGSLRMLLTLARGIPAALAWLGIGGGAAGAAGTAAAAGSAAGGSGLLAGAASIAALGARAAWALARRHPVLAAGSAIAAAAPVVMDSIQSGTATLEAMGANTASRFIGQRPDRFGASSLAAAGSLASSVGTGLTPEARARAEAGQGSGPLPFWNFQSQLMGIDQAWSRLQEAGAGMSPGEQEILRIQTDMLQVLQQSASGQKPLAVTQTNPMPPTTS